ncbi:oxidoreductase [Ramlibacter sp. AW1]|uniref:Oxidoreductase n=1 Tax=Ramlibacter aurantiacus TaxID=2801330 RepID=A0A936ZNG1_9BURK|nr:PDR/VanB family oxidoreductase [Ramlibacter aurantiacus]MBL0420871.1 oxidoreductase [Ramlibacter aurantiacus]
MTEAESLRPLSVTRKETIARDIHLFELRDAQGAPLPPFTAGSHLAVRVPGGAMRQYSLCNDPAETDRYQIAVKRDEQGRGGSMSLVDGVQVGDELMVGTPTNLFELNDKAKSFVLVAGGIGITPIMAMMRTLQAEGLRPFKLYYFTRDPEGTAFLDELKGGEFAGKVVIHHDHGDPARSYDLWKIFEKVASGAHVYCCGPNGLMDAVRDMTGHWPTTAVHFESFGGDTKPHADDKPFDVQLRRSGITVQVGATQTILDAVRQAGVKVASSCESGTCGTCKTRLLEGQADHRDLVLMEEERGDQIMVCVSRACSDTLVLDL